MGRLMNNYFYGKAGKGDFKKSDLPKNRRELFWQTLRVRISGLFRMNLMTCVAFIPLIVLLFSFSYRMIIYYLNLNTVAAGGTVMVYSQETEEYTEDTAATEAYGAEWNSLTEYAQANAGVGYSSDYMIFSMIFSRFLLNTGAFSVSFWEGLTSSLLLLLIPCILITGPVQAGMAYVCRNWARDEHAFIWSDFKDAVKNNWKQALGVSALYSVLPLLLCVAFQYYWGLTYTMGMFMYIPVALIICVALLSFLSLAYVYPMLMGYKVTFRQLLKNSFILAAGRLPHTLGVRLAMLVPALIAAIVIYLWTSVFMYALLILAAYYVLLGNALARFSYASLSNSVFEKFINPNIPGAPTRSGLAEEEDEDDDDEPAEDAAESGK